MIVRLPKVELGEDGIVRAEEQCTEPIPLKKIVLAATFGIYEG
jgi:hypothetical protein